MPPPRGAWNPIECAGDYTTTKNVYNDTYPAIDPTKTNLTGKAIFVSGASKGLGKAMAISFAKAGASKIAIGARSDLSTAENEAKFAAKEAGRYEPQVLKVKLDITDQESVDAAAKLVGEQFGAVDVVINNAGIIDGRGLVGESDPLGWWTCMDANLRGAYLITRSFLPLLLKSELKTLVTVSSVGAHCISPSLSAYQTSKLAVLRFTEFVAAEYADKGIIAFAMHPGNILTDIVGKGEGMDEKLKAVFTETPQICADSMVYLSKERREWLSGRYINTCWDLEELCSDPIKKRIVEGDMLKVKLIVPNEDPRQEYKTSTYAGPGEGQSW